MSISGTAPPATARGLLPCYLDFDGMLVGHVHDCEGGFPKAVVVEERHSNVTAFTTKQVGGVLYEPIRLTFGSSMGKRLYEWISAQLGMKWNPVSGAIRRANANLEEIARIEFAKANFVELRLPELDARLKEAVHLSLTLGPFKTERKRGSGKIAPPSSGGLKTRMLISSNFRFETEGPPPHPDWSKIVRIEPITVTAEDMLPAKDSDITKTAKLSDITRTVRPADITKTTRLSDFGVTHKTLRVSDVVLTMPENAAEPLYQWFDDFVIKGKHELQKNAKLHYLSPDRQETIFTVGLSGLGIRSIQQERPAQEADAFRLVRVEMYCEKLELKKYPQ